MGSLNDRALRCELANCFAEFAVERYNMQFVVARRRPLRLLTASNTSLRLYYWNTFHVHDIVSYHFK